MTRYNNPAFFKRFKDAVLKKKALMFSLSLISLVMMSFVLYAISFKIVTSLYLSFGA